MRRLARSGFKRDFIQRAILPDWWEVGCENDASILPDMEIRVARFMGVSVSDIRNPAAALVTPAYQGAQLRRLKNVSRDQLLPAIHAAMQVAAALERTVSRAHLQVRLPPSDGLAWRREITHEGQSVTLRDILEDLWIRGIPVMTLDILPTPAFQGLACVVHGRPVILLGYRHDEPGRLSSLVAHEAGHIAAGHCTSENPVIDQEDDVMDDEAIEQTAEHYSTRVLVGGDDIPRVNAENYRDLATKASQIESNHGADAGAIIFSWARTNGDYTTATMAVKALYRSSGGRRQVAELFARHVDLESASESDRLLLRCAVGGAEPDAPSC